MARLKAANNAQTTLSYLMEAGATTCTVVNGSILPAAPFLITVGSEIMEVGAKSGNNLSSILRAQEGTTAAAHQAGAVVESKITAGMYNESITLASVLSGLSTITNAVITAADTILSAFGKLQAQISGHLAETVNYVTSASRTLNTDGTGAGTQTIAISLPLAPKKIRIDAGVNSASFGSWGEYGSNGQNCMIRYGTAGYSGVDGKMGQTVSNIIKFTDGNTDSWTGTITAVTSTSIEITWVKAGNGFTGTASLRITAETH